MKDRFKTDYEETEIESLAVHEHAGTKDPDDRIIIVRARYNKKNSGPESKEMINMYSSDLAACLSKEFPDVQEVAVMWDAEYIDGSAKCAYERYEDGKMYEMDMVWDKKFDE